jgi:hypothetical protein
VRHREETVGTFNARIKTAMIRWKYTALGAGVFVGAHLVVAAGWQEWFSGGDVPPWFLNSGRAVAFTAGLLFLASAFAGLRTGGVPRDAMVVGGNVSAGAVVAMCVVLVLIGPGTLFPIALAIGAGVAVISGAAGALAGSAIARR